MHPNLAQPKETSSQRDAYIASSARFKVLFRILDQISKHREKALIFVEVRDAQIALYELIMHRYKLAPPRPEIINGATAAAVRDRIRQRFQRDKGFDVLILGPKAAGFGLTLTAANHVIHLNRWWNPAVEDQCSDRVYRIGQTKPVTIYLPQAVHSELGAQGSFDGVLHELLEAKRDLSREIVVPVHFSEKDLHKLFKQSAGEVNPSTDGQLDHIDGMDWRGFERWVSDQLILAEFRVQLGSGSGDGGADVIAHLNGHTVVIQCKHGGNGASAIKDESAVKDLLRARQQHRLSPPIILAAVTNGRFSLATENLAQRHGVQLFDRSRLLRMARILARQSGLEQAQETNSTAIPANPT